MPQYEVKPSVRLAAQVRAHECAPGDPAVRPLRVYAVDPSLRRAEGCIATINVPYEPLLPGPIGRLFEVEAADGDNLFTPLDLEDPKNLINNGLAPSVVNPGFHQQMVYAVASSVYATFRSALGRLIAWGHDENEALPRGPLRLKLRPHVGPESANATYDNARREIRFGYAEDRQMPGSRTFACLSHDVIVHEMTHALIDGLRSRFTIPTNPDVLGFHEGLSDIIALLHHFLYPEVLAAQIRKVGPTVERSELLTEIAANFGLSTIGPEAVRGAMDRADVQRYACNLEAHEMGRVLAAAVFSAFIKIFRRKTERYIRLAGPRAEGFWPEELIQILAEKASKLARNFLNICIRALDYCPPLDLELGEYLRALITADLNLIPNDDWGYRETLIECFAERGIFPPGVMHMSEEALVWRAPNRPLPAVARLSFSNLRFNGDPSVPASAGELDAQAHALGAFITQSDICEEFGLMQPSGRNKVDLPAIQSIRVARRVGPDGQVLFDLVAEVTQRRVISDPESGMRAKVMGGSTIVIGPRGEIRCVISKSIQRQRRISDQLKFQRESPFWSKVGDQYKLVGQVFPLLHQGLARVRPHYSTQTASKST